MDLCGVDYPEREHRFEVVYNLLSVHHNQRARVKLSADETTQVPSVTGLYAAAGWYEREAWTFTVSSSPETRTCAGC